MPPQVQQTQLRAQPYKKQILLNGSVREIALPFKPYLYTYMDSPYTGKVVDYYSYEDKKIRSVGAMKNGFLEGPWIYYHTNGRIAKRGKYKDGNPDSIWNQFFDGGNVQMICNCSGRNDSVTCDTTLAWYSPGLAMIWRHGDTTVHYYPNGARARVSVLRNPPIEELYNQLGQLISIEHDHEKDFYGPKNAFIKRRYYLQNKQNLTAFFNQNYAWSAQQKKDIEKADSLDFDYTNKADPVVKIYWPK
jgi:hypothetical protein